MHHATRTFRKKENMEEAFLCQLSEQIAENGGRSGVKLERGDNDESLFEHWADSRKNGTIVIIGEATDDGIRPIKTFVPIMYVEYTCNAGCRDGHVLSHIRLGDETCLRCGGKRQRYEVVNGKPVGVSETLKT